VMDTEPMDVVVSGSSAAMLSREITSSLRGRALEAQVFPFSFREALRHRGEEPDRSPERWSSAEHSRLRNHLRSYLLEGGFPEAQGLDPRSRRVLLTSYVDSAVLRDVIERHGVRQPLALQWLVRQLLATAGGAFSVNRLHGALRSQGIAIGRELLQELVGHLEDAFLVHSVAVASGSLRRQQSLPRKIYPIDPGLIPLYDRSGRTNLGHALETAVVLELLRRGAEISYVRTARGTEVDLLARYGDGRGELIQVCTSLADEVTRGRELRALADAAHDPLTRGCEATVIGLEPLPSGCEWLDGVRWRDAQRCWQHQKDVLTS
jgi:predicted AAA+ superfamily ATPase